MRRPSCLYWGVTFAVVFPWSSIQWSWPPSVAGRLSSRSRISRDGTFRRNFTLQVSNLQCVFPPSDQSLELTLPLPSRQCYLGLTLPGPWAELLAFRSSSTSSSISISSLYSAQKDGLQIERCDPLASNLLYMFTCKFLCSITSVSSPSPLLSPVSQSFILTLSPPRTLFQKAPQQYLQIPAHG